MHWLGKELPPWSQRCPVHVTASPNLGASGETTFAPVATGVGNWRMVVNGTEERILDSVLPHEISHTILATHFAKYAQQGRFLPRWADEGACTTVEADVEKKKHRHFLNQFLRTGRGLAFNRMFALKDYPKDILPLYAQGHSAVQFLIDQSSPREFIRFLDDGMASGNWQMALRKHYQYETIGHMQQLWNKWLADGSPRKLIAYAPKLEQADSAIRLASNAIASDFEAELPTARITEQRTIPAQFAINPRANEPAPVRLAVGTSVSGSTPGYLSGPSWYRDRLRAVAGGAPTGDFGPGASVPLNRQSTATSQPIPTTNLPDLALANVPPRTNDTRSTDGWRGTGWRLSKNSEATGPVRQSVARPQDPQSVGIQVLEMGSSIPIRAGGQSSLQPAARSSVLPAGHIGPTTNVPVVR